MYDRTNITNSVNQKNVKDSPVSIEQHIHTDILRIDEITNDILQTELTDWQIAPQIWTLKNNCGISLHIEEKPGDWKNDPLLKGKINEAAHDPNTRAEQMRLFHNNNPISDPILGLWLDGGRIMLPYPNNEETNSGFQYFINNPLEWHLALLQTTKMFGGIADMNFWLEKLNIQKKF